MSCPIPDVPEENSVLVSTLLAVEVIACVVCSLRQQPLAPECRQRRGNSRTSFQRTGKFGVLRARIPSARRQRGVARIDRRRCPDARSQKLRSWWTLLRTLVVSPADAVPDCGPCSMPACTAAVPFSGAASSKVIYLFNHVGDFHQSHAFAIARMLLYNRQAAI